MKNKKYYKKKTIFFLFFKLINILLLLFGMICMIFSNENNLKTAICLIIKQENRYIKEFVDYYKKLNIKKIFLYDNNDINGEYSEGILSNYIKLNFVEIINYRGKHKPQFHAYNHCYISNNKYFNWIAFFDVDEYLYINSYTDINKFLSLNRFRKCSSILFNWKYYGDNDKIYYEPRPLQERFTKPFYFKKQKGKNIKCLKSAGKTIVRTGLNLTWAHFPHYLKNKPICKPNGRILKNYFSPPQYWTAHIKHYATKSTEEFIERVIKGTVYSKQKKSNYLKYRIKDYYFLFNKFNKEKKIMFEKKI
jgi:hypothetical protein